MKITLRQVMLAVAMMSSLLIVSNSHAALIDTKLALAIDVSGSVSSQDFSLQMQGYQAAFENATVQANIDALTTGIAVEVFFFSSSAVSGNIETLLTSASDAAAFAATIGGLARPFSGGTNPASGMNLAREWLLDTTTWESSNLIIDVSGDGTGSASSDRFARDQAAAAGIDINGLAIDDPGFFEDGCGPNGYYTQNIITTGGLCFQAAGFDDFESAVISKIRAETGGPDPQAVSEPGAFGLLVLGLALLRARFRRA